MVARSLTPSEQDARLLHFGKLHSDAWRWEDDPLFVVEKPSGESYRFLHRHGTEVKGTGFDHLCSRLAHALWQRRRHRLRPLLLSEELRIGQSTYLVGERGGKWIFAQEITGADLEPIARALANRLHRGL